MPYTNFAVFFKVTFVFLVAHLVVLYARAVLQASLELAFVNLGA